MIIFNKVNNIIIYKFYVYFDNNFFVFVIKGDFYIVFVEIFYNLVNFCEWLMYCIFRLRV